VVVNSMLLKYPLINQGLLPRLPRTRVTVESRVTVLAGRLVGMAGPYNVPYNCTLYGSKRRAELLGDSRCTSTARNIRSNDQGDESWKRNHFRRVTNRGRCVGYDNQPAPPACCHAGSPVRSNRQSHRHCTSKIGNTRYAIERSLEQIRAEIVT